VIDRLDLVEAPALEQGRTALRLVTEELKARSGPSDGQDAPEGPKPKGCHLKLVK
jgi:hypothetical protein